MELRNHIIKSSFESIQIQFPFGMTPGKHFFLNVYLNNMYLTEGYVELPLFYIHSSLLIKQRELHLHVGRLKDCLKNTSTGKWVKVP